jgi:hypothetical protein
MPSHWSIFDDSWGQNTGSVSLSRQKIVPMSSPALKFIYGSAVYLFGYTTCPDLWLQARCHRRSSPPVSRADSSALWYHTPTICTSVRNNQTGLLSQIVVVVVSENRLKSVGEYQLTGGTINQVFNNTKPNNSFLERKHVSQILQSKAVTILNRWIICQVQRYEPSFKSFQWATFNNMSCRLFWEPSVGGRWVIKTP